MSAITVSPVFGTETVILSESSAMTTSGRRTVTVLSHSEAINLAEAILTLPALQNALNRKETPFPGLPAKAPDPFGRPEGWEDHNPDNLTPDQVGENDGWRLLTKCERKSRRTLDYNPSEHIQAYTYRDPWAAYPNHGNIAYMTYRTKMPYMWWVKEGGYTATGQADAADEIAASLDPMLQRAGVVWPRHETAAIIRRIIQARQ